jgi:hypothetical protein
MNAETSQATPTHPEKRPSGVKMVMTVVAVAIVTSVMTVWLTTTYLFPKEFKPVKLNEREQRALEAKLALLDLTMGRAQGAAGRRGDHSHTVSRQPHAPLTPERYNEAGASREIRLSERELNALLARNTNLAHRFAIDLSQDLASAKLLIPLDPDFPFLGGKTLRVTAGLELRYNDNNPVVMLKGVSIWAVPIPNAWLGGLKNVDLVKEFGARGGFWQAFAAGVENIRVEEGTLSIKLKE